MEELILNPADFNSIEFEVEKSSSYVTASELSHFIDNQNELREKLSEIKTGYKKEHGYSADMANERLEEECRISVETMRKTIMGTTKCTRHFLYKFTVGLHMTLEEANMLFDLCDGMLNPKCMADYICIRALEDKDSIDTFIEQFEKNVGIKLVRKIRNS